MFGVGTISGGNETISLFIPLRKLASILICEAHSFTNKISLFPFDTMSLEAGFILLLVATLSSAAKFRECLSPYYYDRDRFRVCKSHVCLLFVAEIPFVFVDKRLHSEDHVQPFRCNKESSVTGASGPFFEYVKEIKALDNSYCIWAGPECSFDGMVSFVKSVSGKNSSEQFIAGSMLFISTGRISNQSIPSAPFLESDIVVIGPSTRKETTMREAVISVVQPFETLTWVLIVCVILTFIATRLFIALVFTSPWSFPMFLENLMDGFLPERSTNSVLEDTNKQAERRYLNSIWFSGAKIFFIIFILFYELAVVNFVLSERKIDPAIDLYNLKEEDLRKFAVVKGSAQLHFFLKRINPSFRANNVSYNADNETEIFTKLNEDSDIRSFGVFLELAAQFHINHRSLCKKLAVYKTKSPLFRYSAVWFYGSNISQNKRLEIDIGITALREESKIWPPIQSIVEGSNSECSVDITKIKPFIFLGPLVVFIGPFFLLILLYLVYILLRPALATEET